MSHSGLVPPEGIAGARPCGKLPNQAASNEPGWPPGLCSEHPSPECDIVEVVTLAVILNELRWRYAC